MILTLKWNIYTILIIRPNTLVNIIAVNYAAVLFSVFHILLLSFV